VRHDEGLDTGRALDGRGERVVVDRRTAEALAAIETVLPSVAVYLTVILLEACETNSREGLRKTKKTRIYINR
jgi:hypothetical protein